jgi:hypothetical protein
MCRTRHRDLTAGVRDIVGLSWIKAGLCRELPTSNNPFLRPTSMTIAMRPVVALRLNKDAQ